MSPGGQATLPRGRAPKRLTRKEKQAETRRQLLDAAERVFLRRGLQGSSVEEIAAEAGFTRGAFYSNFKGKDELFVELLQDRVYRRYAQMAEEAEEQPGTPRERLRWGIERVRDVQKGEDGSWLFRLWLECLTQAARDEEFRKLAATFWSGNRGVLAEQSRAAFKEVGRKPPLPPKQIATAMIALDVGLAVQHLVDPDEAPLDLYVPLFDLLFGSLVDPDTK
ncbi:MAG TPA: TetR/AcrR family transcriptional regulator [Solirubrobacterales bacterium]|nr:TetR/AcrR family transcriptional regulator [Solirubrobacterales bacterium]